MGRERIIQAMESHRAYRFPADGWTNRKSKARRAVKERTMYRGSVITVVPSKTVIGLSASKAHTQTLCHFPRCLLARAHNSTIDVVVRQPIIIFRDSQ